MFFLARHQGGILTGRSWNSRGKVQARIKVTAIAGDAANPDKVAGAAGRCFGDEADAPVGGDYEVESAATERLIDGLEKVRVTMDVLDPGRNPGNLVRTTMKNRDLVASVQQAVDEKGAGRTSSSNNKCFHYLHQVEAGAADHHLVVRDAASATLGGIEQAFAIGNHDVDAAEAVTASVRRFDETHACVIQRHLEASA